MSENNKRIWFCKIGEAALIPAGADAPMRQAVAMAYKELTGEDAKFCFSGWGGELTEPERAVVENRLPAAPEPAPQVEGHDEFPTAEAQRIFENLRKGGHYLAASCIEILLGERDALRLQLAEREEQLGELKELAERMIAAALAACGQEG